MNTNKTPGGPRPATFPSAEIGGTSIFSANWGPLNMIVVKSSDRIISTNGLQTTLMTGKGNVANQTTRNVFSFLSAFGLKTYFIDKYEEDSFFAFTCRTIPVNCVARRIACGSFLERNPDVQSGSVFEKPEIEFFLRADTFTSHSPLLLAFGYADSDISLVGGKGDLKLQAVRMYDSKSPQSVESLRGMSISSDNDFNTKFWWKDYIEQMRSITNLAFFYLEYAWKNLGMTLIDLKIEFGIDQFGRLLICGVIDNDSWLMWPGGDESKMFDKRVFLNKDQPTREHLRGVLTHHEEVMRLTVTLGH